VNVIDDAGGHFLFPRLALLIRQDASRTIAGNSGTTPDSAK
jgi:hypothetical protein